MATADPLHDLKEIEMLAELSQRPIIYQVLIAFDREPQIHRFLMAWFDQCHAPGIAHLPAGSHQYHEFHLHLRRLEPVRRFRSLARGHAWAAPKSGCESLATPAAAPP